MDFSFYIQKYEYSNPKIEKNNPDYWDFVVTSFGVLDFK